MFGLHIEKQNENMKYTWVHFYRTGQKFDRVITQAISLNSPIW